MSLIDNSSKLLSKDIKSESSFILEDISKITLPNWGKFPIEQGVRLINREALFKRGISSGSGKFGN